MWAFNKRKTEITKLPKRSTLKINWAYVDKNWNIERREAQKAHLNSSLECFLIKVDYCVTRFDKILPLWQKFTSLWQIFRGWLLIWQNVESILAILWHYWANFHGYKLPNIKNNLTIWSLWLIPRNSYLNSKLCSDHTKLFVLQFVSTKAFLCDARL